MMIVYIFLICVIVVGILNADRHVKQLGQPLLGNAVGKTNDNRNGPDQ